MGEISSELACKKEKGPRCLTHLEPKCEPHTNCLVTRRSCRIPSQYLTALITVLEHLHVAGGRKFPESTKILSIHEKKFFGLRIRLSLEWFESGRDLVGFEQPDFAFREIIDQLLIGGLIHIASPDDSGAVRIGGVEYPLLVGDVLRAISDDDQVEGGIGFEG